MTQRYAAVLRVVNVGGTGKLPMSKLVAFCETPRRRHPRCTMSAGCRANASRSDAARSMCTTTAWPACA